MLSKKLTIKQCASLPYKYVRVRSECGLSIVCNVAIDKLVNRKKIETQPNDKTIWVSFSPVSINEYITFKDEGSVLDRAKLIEKQLPF